MQFSVGGSPCYWSELLLRILLQLLRGICFLHLFPQHGLESSEYLLFIVLSQHVRELGHFFTFLWTAYKFFSHYSKPKFLRHLHISGNCLFNRFFVEHERLIRHQLNSAKFVRAHWLLANYFVLSNLAQFKRLVTCHTLNQVLIEHFSHKWWWGTIATTNLLANFTGFFILL